MTVRTYQRKALRLVVDRTRGAANGRIGIEKTIFVEFERMSAGVAAEGNSSVQGIGTPSEYVDSPNNLGILILLRTNDFLCMVKLEYLTLIGVVR